MRLSALAALRRDREHHFLCNPVKTDKSAKFYIIKYIAAVPATHCHLEQLPLLLRGRIEAIRVGL
jgi:hypothetical protein